MEPIGISYRALKLVVAGGAAQVYYAKAGEDIVAVIVSAGALPNLKCFVSGEDIADFDATIRPDAIEVAYIDDAFGLVPLGITPPAP